MHFIGIEIGHGGTRAVALDLESAVIRAEAWVPHDWIEGLPAGYREQNPAQWIDAVDRAVRQCLAALDGQKDRVAAIGVAGPQRGLVLLDEANRIIRPAKLAGDVSVKRQADEIARAFGGAPGLIELAGQAPGVESAAAECLWLKQHEPYHFQRAASLLTAQDFIAYWLTGERATEPGSASGTGLLDIRTRKWSAELLDFIDPQLAAKLPPIGASDQPRGLLRPALAREWGVSEIVQVGAGSALADACRARRRLRRERHRRRGTRRHRRHRRRRELAGDRLSRRNHRALQRDRHHGSASPPPPTPPSPRKCCAATTDGAPEQFEAMVASVSPGADGCCCCLISPANRFPRLPDGTGVLHGMTAENFTPAHMARAAAEGVALGLGYAMSRLRDLGFDPPEIRLLGPGVASPVTRQLMADVFGAPVVPVSSRQGAAVGAAMQAAVGVFPPVRRVARLRGNRQLSRRRRCRNPAAIRTRRRTSSIRK